MVYAWNVCGDYMLLHHPCMCSGFLLTGDHAFLSDWVAC